ncbi:MAG TPA: hypothetical protein VFV93_06995 [Thermomicrobiales bacterium]|nr:hypothetical protein [Thermomicrobiales bacterium]
MTRSDRRWLFAVIAIVAVAQIALAIRVLDRLDPLTGDEPFYVMTALSIMNDRDLDESNNYADRDYDEFYPPEPLPAGWDGWPAFPRTLPPHPATSDRNGLHTKHGLGLSFLIATPYEIAGRPGAVAVVLICSLFVAANMFLLAHDVNASPAWAAAIAIMLAVSMPLAPYSSLLFPEIPAALLLIYAIRRLATPSNALYVWVLTGMAIGFLPWLHQRFAPTAVVLTGIVLYRFWKSREYSGAIAALTPVAVGGLSLVGYNLWLYGSPFQSTADHAGFNGPEGTLNATFGLLLDAQWGLLIAAPLYAVVLAGIPFWLKSSPTARMAALAIVPYLVVVATYRVWWGEWGPPARYLVPVAPLAAGVLATLVVHVSTPVRAAIVGLWCAGMVLVAAGAINPQRFYHQPDGINNLYMVLDGWFGTDIAGHLIAFQPYAISPLDQRVVASLMLCTIIALMIVVAWPVDRQRAAQPTEEISAGD